MSDDKNADTEDGYDSVDHNSHPSLPLALQEVRNLYTDEEDRRRTVETKIGILLSIDAIVISVASSFSGFGSLWKVLIVLLAMFSSVIGLYILWPREYNRPGPEDIDDIFGDSQREQSDFEKQYTNDYRAAISSNIDKNDDRYKSFKICSVLTFLSILLIPISQIPFSELCSLF